MSLPVLLLAVIVESAFAAPPPSIDEPLRTTLQSPADAAVVIGNEDYSSLPDVSFAARDAKAFSDWLVYSRGVPMVRVHRLVNATDTVMADSFEAAAQDVGKGGILWIYYAGHGATVLKSDGTTERALVAGNAAANAGTLNGLVVPVSRIEALASRSRASQTILVLDTSYANANRDGEPIMDGMPLVPASGFPSVPRVTVWSAVTDSEVATAYTPAQHGLFTYFVLSALQGRADTTPADGSITIGETQTWFNGAMGVVSEHRQNPSVRMDPWADHLVLVKGLPESTPMDIEALPKAGTAGTGAARPLVAPTESASSTPESVPVPVPVPSTPSGNGSSKHRRTGFLVGSGVSLAMGGALVLVANALEASSLDHLHENTITDSNAIARRSLINAQYLLGYGLAGLGGTLGVIGLVDAGTSFVPWPGLVLSGQW